MSVGGFQATEGWLPALLQCSDTLSFVPPPLALIRREFFWNAGALVNLHVCQQAFNVFKSWKMFKGKA